MWEQGPKGRTTETEKLFFMQHIKRRCFCRTDRDVLNFVLRITDPLLKNWRKFAPLSGPAKNGHFITDLLKRSAFRRVSFCVPGKVHRERDTFYASHGRQIQRMLLKTSSVNWLVSKMTCRVLETMQNYKENPSKWLTSHLTNYGYHFYGS